MQKKNAILQSPGDRAFLAFVYAILALITLLALYPLYFTVIASISDPYKVSTGQIYLLPSGFTLEAYQNILKEAQVWVGYRNTILYTVFGTALHVICTIPCAYALSKRDLPGRRFFTLLLMFTMYFSGGMIPSYLLVKNLGLIDSPLILVILGAVSVYNVVVARTFFRSSIPEELYESCRIDGGSELVAFFNIALPLSKPIIAVIALYAAVGQWNGYFNALIYTSKPSLQPLQLVLRNVLILNQNFAVADAVDAEELAYMAHRAYMVQTMKYALVFVASAPVLIAYPFVQKYFVKGVMIGSVKG